ncbi:multidrug efflux SMR transporter [Lysinibacillus sphaericus]|uniref:QacE family quaternary ammonium compound efflux SMR transporter n=3 Tax=Lysinibacillus TaxID=400634 RepID=A0A2S0K2Y0_LYSSH|nr:MULTISPECIES: multidrug efflux SMR transporter [Lysinibacillus]AHN21158.1 multidrug resistance protein SMR [Lysinibacillus varians]AVK97730.1 QacE family quaternary ammonium compound efflux SMR transporter [Lysinibacillus sphaericus]MCS1382978.1 multidrug efflux SMR transporter [Lysinibacillus sphaericus]MED4543212.1 multidrug efflux SMR transporter [Lysinibacillus sphaericus]TKI20963.1 multidrug efflux SMR transporter [Lysinibacillus sphaericus]
MAWVALVIAGLCEMMGVFMISKYNEVKNIKNLVLLIAVFTVSFLGLAYAMETLPMGTTYAIWTGIGAAGGAILGMLFFNESKDWRRIVCIVLVLGAAICLKLLS